MKVPNLARNVAFAFLLSGAAGVSLADDDKAAWSSGGSVNLHAAMMKGMQGARSMKMTGDVDKDFAMMMTMHHQQAIAMARVPQEQGHNPAPTAAPRTASREQPGAP